MQTTCGYVILYCRTYIWRRCWTGAEATRQQL